MSSVYKRQWLFHPITSERLGDFRYELRKCIVFTAVVFCLSSDILSADERKPAIDPASAEFFEAHILPVLVGQCYECHSVKSGKDEGGLLLDNRAALLQGGSSGPAVVVGDASSSLILSAIRHEDFEMPQGKPRLPENVIANFEKWIANGAMDPRDGPVGVIQKRQYSPAQRNYWAFKTPQKTPPPSVVHQRWPINSIDLFVLSKLEQSQLQPSPPASKRELVRRLYFDLLGLPPTPDEVAAFVADDRPDAYEHLVDRLLDDRHYGEKWGQFWLDVIRFAESEGFEYDRALPGAWRFRDYVIRSFNDDKPFDQFVREQLAGDQIKPVARDGAIAAGFHRFGPVRRNAGNPDIALSRNEVLTERTDILGSAFLGLTIGCARCHDHKFDPIAQRDYYSLQAYLAATQEHDLVVASDEKQQAWEAKSRDINTKIEALKKQLDDVASNDRTKISEQLAKLQSELPSPLPSITSIRDQIDQRTPIHVLARGVWEHKGDRVAPRPLGVLVDHDLQPLAADAPGLRAKLADWLTSPDHPLTARVIVNRIWQGHFGVGLVKTANDFGQNGERPSHPELLDYLAVEFMESGWRMKTLHRLVVTSSAYRQSSATDPTARTQTMDPDNRLLWRFPRRRLSAEEIRDAMLAVSGTLNRKMYGPSVMLPVEARLIEQLYKPSQWKVTEDRSEHNRRSIYLMAKRNLRLPFMEVFDQPTLLSSCAMRQSSTHAPQALELLNGRISNELAVRFAERLRAEAGEDHERIVQRAFELALGRPATKDEAKLSVEFLRSESLTEFALAMFNLNIFLTVL